MFYIFKDFQSLYIFARRAWQLDPNDNRSGLEIFTELGGVRVDIPVLEDTLQAYTQLQMELSEARDLLELQQAKILNLQNQIDRLREDNQDLEKHLQAYEGSDQ